MDYRSDDNAFRLIHLPEIDSTNRFLKELPDGQSDNAGEMVVVVTDYQTDGRGQRGNVWSSSRGVNLLFSIGVAPLFLKAQDQFLVSQIASLAVRDVLMPLIHDVTVKWPNDIYWHDKKICGILIENTLQDGCIASSVIGIGLNVNQDSFDAGPVNPISVKIINGKDTDLNVLLNDVMRHFIAYYEQLKSGDAERIVRLYHQSLYRRDGMFTYSDKDGLFKATIQKVEPGGRLVLCDEEGRLRRYYFKEVKFE